MKYDDKLEDIVPFYTTINKIKKFKKWGSL